MRVAAVVLAAGAGVRLGADVPKALVAVHGQTLVERSARSLLGHPRIDEVVVVVPQASREQMRALVPSAATVAVGGSSRQASVRCGLAALSPSVDVVLIHDSARAFAPGAVVDRIIEALLCGADAVIPVLPVLDAVKRVDAHGTVIDTLDRSALRLVQTPQGFRRSVIDAAHAAAQRAGSDGAVDDAALVEALGLAVRTVEGDPRSFKITVPADLARAQLLGPLDA